MDDQLVGMDTRLIYLEDTVQRMNLILMEQDKTITNLKDAVRELKDKVRELDDQSGSSEEAGENERPPHY